MITRRSRIEDADAREREHIVLKCCLIAIPQVDIPPPRFHL
jgi:hypothetical protein